MYCVLALLVYRPDLYFNRDIVFPTYNFNTVHGAQYPDLYTIEHNGASSSTRVWYPQSCFF